MTLDRYIDQESLEEIKQEVESSGIWDFKVDSVSVTFDGSVLNRFDGIEEHNIEGLYNKTAQVYYYGNLILVGVVGEVSYNWADQELEMEIYSQGKIVSDIEVNISNIWPLGEPLKQVKVTLLNAINRGLRNQGYSSLVLPFPPGYGGLFSFGDDPYINVDDFEFFQRITGGKTTRLNPLLRPAAIYKPSEFAILQGGDPTFRWVFYQRLGFGDDGIQKINEDGTLGDINDINSIQRILMYEKAEDWPTDGGLANYAQQILFDNASLTWSGQGTVGDYFWGVANNELLFMTLEQLDLFIYNYENAKAGQVLSDFATITNSITWIGPDGHIRFQSRSGLAGLNNPKLVIDLESEVIDQRGEQLELPGDVVIADIVEEGLINYYDTYLNGVFVTYSIVMHKDQFTPDEYPILLKNLVIKVRGQFLDVGIIKSVTYKEDLLELTTQKRVDK